MRTISNTLNTNSSASGRNAPLVAVHPNVAGTLCASGAGLNRPAGMGSEVDLCVAIAHDCRNHVANHEVSGTLQAKNGGGHSLNYINPIAVPFSFKSFGECEESEIGKSLMACDGITTGGLVAEYYAVRRLTPVECERLQGFADNWTAYGHDGKKISDSVRYRALGNSVAIPCVAYVLGGIAEQEDATT